MHKREMCHLRRAHKQFKAWQDMWNIAKRNIGLCTLHPWTVQCAGTLYSEEWKCGYWDHRGAHLHPPAALFFIAQSCNDSSLDDCHYDILHFDHHHITFILVITQQRKLSSQHVIFGSPEYISNSEIACENDCNTWRMCHLHPSA